MAKASKAAWSLNHIVDGFANELRKWKYRLKEVKNTLLNGVYTGEKYSIYLLLLLVKTIRKFRNFSFKIVQLGKKCLTHIACIYESLIIIF